MGAHRPAFTLIELLVVVAIIAILSSLALSGVMKLRSAQMKSFTETNIAKLASALDQQWKASMDDIREEQPDLTRDTPSRPNPLSHMAGGDLRRARIIYRKLKLKARFPTNFSEAVAPTGVAGIDLKIKEPVFQRELAGVSPLAPISADMQASILLFLSLSQARRGTGSMMGPSELDPTMLGVVEVPLVAGGTKQFTYFKDSWDNPIRLYNFPTGNDELNEPPHVKSDESALDYKKRDPQDPDGILYEQNWAPGRRALFAPIHALNPVVVQGNNNVSVARHLVPVIASAGPDGQFGLNPITMGPDPANAAAAGDNIYSFRLRRAGARGD